MDRFTYKEKTPQEEEVRCIDCNEPFEPTDMWDDTCDKCLEQAWYQYVGRMSPKRFLKEVHDVCEGAENGWDQNTDDIGQVRIWYKGLSDDQLETVRNMIKEWGASYALHHYTCGTSSNNTLWVHCELGKDEEDQVTLVPAVKGRGKQ